MFKGDKLLFYSLTSDHKKIKPETEIASGLHFISNYESILIFVKIWKRIVFCAV